MRYRKLILCLALLGVASCAAPSDGEDANPMVQESPDKPGLRLVADESSDDALLLRVDFAPSAAAQPRVAEIWIAHDPDVVFERAEPGEAVTVADKQLVAQERDGRLRLVVFSPGNTNTLGSGTLAHLRFSRTGSARARFEIVAESPAFAPAKANQGLTIGAPLEL